MQPKPPFRRRLWGAVAATAAASLALVVNPVAPAAAQTDDPATAETLGERPYMGWSSYSMQVYSGDGQWITGDQLIAQSDAMHERLQEYGYEYINVDAAWNGGVDGYGRPVPSATLYPDGLQAVIDHVHGNGQKFGLYFIPGLGPEVYEADLPIYGAPGCSTGDIAAQPLQDADYWGIGYKIDFANPCSQKYIDSIVDLIASWGVDFVKFDSVTPGSGVSDLSLDARDDVAAWSAALERHGIWMELSWALDIGYADLWAEHAQGWRVDWDVECYCPGEALTQWANVERLFPRVEDWWRLTGPGRGWMDLDSLNVGNGEMDGLTRDERRTAMTLWAIAGSPMYLGNDMTDLDDFGIELLTNEEVIAVQQSGVPARPVSTSTDRQTWYAQNPDGTVTVALFNLGRTEADMALDLSAIGLSGEWKVRDLWAGENEGRFEDDEFTAENVPINGTRLFELTPKNNAAVTLNDDAQRVAYEGDWVRNGGDEVAATVQPLRLGVGDSSTGEVPVPPEGAGTVVLNDDAEGIAYTGMWNGSSGRGFGDYEDDVHWTETDGDAVEYTFVGTGIDYVTETDPSQGEVDVYIDGEFAETVDAHADSRSAQQVLYSVRDLPAGEHTIRLEKQGGRFMLVDRFDVVLESLIDPAAAAVDKALGADADVAVELLRDGGELVGISRGGEALDAGVDYTVEGTTVVLRSEFLLSLPNGETSLDFAFRGDHLDDVHSAVAEGAAVELAFEGTGVAWTGPLAPDQGEVAVYIDGDLVDTVDTSADARLTGRELFSVDGLDDGEHVFRAVKASGDVMRTDAITYTAD
jgi:alpha-galactosidase